MRMRSTRLGMMGLHANRYAPLVAIVVLLGGASLLDNPALEDARIVAHRVRIAEEMETFPYQLGMWIGQDVPIPTSAVEILNPNSLVSRRYSRLETPIEVTLALIHCQDLRDMMGHYPPVCYPATGWTEQEEKGEVIRTLLADTPVEMRLYRFQRFGNIGLEEEQSVISMFMLPEGALLTDMERLKGRSAQGRSLSATGVAQLQMVFAASPKTAKIIEHATEMLSEIPSELIQALTAPIYGEDTEQLKESEQSE